MVESAHDGPLNETLKGGEQEIQSTTWPAGVALLLVAFVGGLCAWRIVGRINPDGICYIQLATYLSRGDPGASVSGYWSPLLIWTIAPLLALGIERLVAARLALLLWAAIGVLAVDRLTRRLGIRGWSRSGVLATVALVNAELATRLVTPDVVVGSALLMYLAASAHPDLIRSRRRAALTGALAGLAYLGKSFALPFTVVHLPVMAAVAWIRARSGENGRQLGARDLIMTMAAAGAALLVVALPWIASLSARYERLTWSTVGPIAHAAAGPEVSPGAVLHPLDGLRAPSLPHQSVLETPEVLPYQPWSPFASARNAAHQARIVAVNTLKAREILLSFDVLGLTLPGLFLAPCAVWLGRRRLAREAPALLALVLWVPPTFAIYVGGYVLVFLEDRYLRSFLLPLALLVLVGVTVAIGTTICGRLQDGPPPTSPWRGANVGTILALSICALFALPPAGRIARRIVVGGPSLRDLERLQESFRETAGDGPIALIPGPTPGQPLGQWTDGQRLAFLLGVRFVGTTDAERVRSAEDPAAATVATVVALRDDDAHADLGPTWVLLRSLHAPAFHRSHLDVFVRRSGED